MLSVCIDANPWFMMLTVKSAYGRYKSQLRNLGSQIRNLRDSIAEQTRLQDDMRRGQYRGVPVDPASAPEVVLPNLQKELKDTEVRNPYSWS